ncbi:hypothetical protein DNK47_02395 [Mycoplasma wenyonii]|uniref:Uncharacterized protein n=1 Tax=Mycoplasma wenyonii TaxID=65123 RepID=A0A328PRJ6_9MOLU|nr:hypothetical protein [Mycoplasma wenyonii]RAO94937.1 hypothetical protein DNK47_02395 [Mycoplasma wenyonii]
MSFLTYTSHPVLFAASVGGVTLGVTLLLLPWKQISFGDSWSNSFLSSSGFNPSSSKEPIERENNCKVVLLEKINTFFPAHIAISCNTQGDSQYDILGGEWIGLFPKNLFKESDKLTLRQQLNIQTWTKEPSEESPNDFYITRFRSSRFVTKDAEIIGKWKYGEDSIDEKTIDFVQLENPYFSEIIYFVHGSKRR